MDKTLQEKYADDMKPTFSKSPKPPLPVKTPGSSGAPGRIIRKVIVVDPNKIKKLGLEQKIIHAVRKLGDSKQSSSDKQRNLQNRKSTAINTEYIKPAVIPDNRLSADSTKATSKNQILSVKKTISESIPTEAAELEYEKHRKSLLYKQLLESFPLKKRENIVKALNLNKNNEVMQTSKERLQTENNNEILRLKATNSAKVDPKSAFKTSENLLKNDNENTNCSDEEFYGFTRQEISSDCGTLRRLSILIGKSETVPVKFKKEEIFPSLLNLKAYLTHKKNIEPEVQDKKKLTPNSKLAHEENTIQRKANDTNDDTASIESISSLNTNKLAYKGTVSIQSSEALSSNVEKRSKLPVTILNLGKTTTSSNLTHKSIEQAIVDKEIAAPIAEHQSNSIIECLEQVEMESRSDQPVSTRTKPSDKGIVVLDQKVYKTAINPQSLSTDPVERTILLKVINCDPITKEIQIQVVDPIINTKPKKKVETDAITNICKLYTKKMMKTGIKYIQNTSSDLMVLGNKSKSSRVDQTDESIILNSNIFGRSDTKHEFEIQSTSQVFCNQMDAAANLPSSIKQESVIVVEPMQQFTISSVEEDIGDDNVQLSQNFETYIPHDNSWPIEITEKDEAGQVQEMDAVEYILRCSQNKHADSNVSSFEDANNLDDSDWDDENEFDEESICESEELMPNDNLYQQSDVTVCHDSNTETDQSMIDGQSYNGNKSGSQVEPNSLYEFEVNSEVITLIEQAEITFESDMKPPQLLSVINLNNCSSISSKQPKNNQTISDAKPMGNTEIENETIVEVAVISAPKLKTENISDVCSEEQVSQNAQILPQKRGLLDYLVALKTDSVDKTNQQVQQGITKDSNMEKVGRTSKIEYNSLEHSSAQIRLLATPITRGRSSNNLSSNEVKDSEPIKCDDEIQHDLIENTSSIAGNTEELVSNSTNVSPLNSRLQEKSINNRTNVSKELENINYHFLDNVISSQPAADELIASDIEQTASTISLSTENCLQADNKICNESSVDNRTISEDTNSNSTQVIHSIDGEVSNNASSDMTGTNVTLKREDAIFKCSQERDADGLKETIENSVITEVCSDKNETDSMHINKKKYNKLGRLEQFINKKNQKNGEYKTEQSTKERKSDRVRKPNVKSDFVMLFGHPPVAEDIVFKNKNIEDTDANIKKPKLPKSRRKNTIPEIDKLTLERRSKRRIITENIEETKGQSIRCKRNTNKLIPSVMEQIFSGNKAYQSIETGSEQLEQNIESRNNTSLTETKRKADRSQYNEKIKHQSVRRKRKDDNSSKSIATIEEVLYNERTENNSEPFITTPSAENKEGSNHILMKAIKRKPGSLRSDEEVKPHSKRRKQKVDNLNKSFPTKEISGNKRVENNIISPVETSLFQQNKEYGNDTAILKTQKNPSRLSSKQGDVNLNNLNMITEPTIEIEAGGLEPNKEASVIVSVTETKRKPARSRKSNVGETVMTDVNSPLQSKAKSKCIRQLSSDIEEVEPKLKKVKTESQSKQTSFEWKRMARKLPANDCYIHPKLLLADQQDDLDKDFEITIEEEKIGETTIKIEREDNESSLDLVRCGTCKQIVNEKMYTEHLKRHFGVGWKEGKDAPINLCSYREVLNAMVYFMKKNKIPSFKCKFCGEVKKSAIGVLGHIQICGLSIDKLNDLMDTCEICGKRLMPYNMWGHTRLCSRKVAALPEPEKALEIQTDSNGRIKRQSLLKAQSSFKEIMRSEYELSVDDFIKPYTPPRGGIYIKWKSEIERKGKAKCYETACSYESNETSDLKAHIKTCSHIRRGGFICIRCQFYNVEQQVVRKHVQIKHVSEMNGLMHNEPEKEDFNDSESECDLQGQNSEDDTESSGPEADTDDLNLDDNMARPNLSYNRRMPLNLKVRDFASCTESIRKQTHVKEILFPNADTQAISVLDETFDLYKTANHNSMQFCFKLNSKLINKSIGCSEMPKEWFKMSSFTSNLIDEEGIIFIGGPITTFAWAPMPSLEKTNDTEYLAVSYKYNYHTHIKMMQPNQEKSIFLIYKCDFIKERNSRLRTKPTLLYGVPCYGPIHHLVFLPSGGYAPESNRLGLLAVASVQTNINIYALPLKAPENCDIISNTLCSLLDIKPSLVLCVDLGENLNATSDYMSQCTRIVWSEMKNHNFIGAGFSNGFAGIWDIRDKDNLTKFDKNGTKYFVPLTYFRAIQNTISGLDFHYTVDGPRWLIVTNNIRDMRTYDLEDMNSPLLLSQEQGQKSAMSDVLWPIYSENPFLSLSDDFVDDSCSVLTKSLLNVTYKIKHNMHSPTGINALTFSPWHNALIGACDNGDIVVQKFKTVSTENTDAHLFNRRYIFYTDIIRLDGKKIPKVQQKHIKGILNDVALATLDCFESNYKEKYGLVFGGPITCDRKNKRHVQSIDRVSPFSIRPLTQVKCIQICPNMSNSNILAIGYNNGFIRIKIIDLDRFV